jgi:hypothetical protein
MSSNNASTDANKGTSGNKQASPGPDTGSKPAESRRLSSTGGHEETGAEKFFSSGGSGGVPIRTGQGYESLANH